MSKLDIGVGDDFPLDETSGENHHGHRGFGRHGHHHHHHEHRHGFHRHGRHRGGRGLGRLALLLVVGGVTALIVEHRLTPGMAYGMIGVGAGLLVLGALVRGIFHWRFHRAIAKQAA